MPTYVAFLRAINLGSRRVFGKHDIRRVVEGLGFEGVDTHLNTGNVRFESRMRSTAKIEELMEHAFAADRGFDVPTVVFSCGDFRDVAAETARLASAHRGLVRHYVYLLKAALTPEQERAVVATSGERGRMVTSGRTAHALLGSGYQNGVVDPLGAAKHLGVATARTATVVQTVATKWC